LFPPVILWKVIMNDHGTTGAPPQQSCRQCGTCCSKGGPAFHTEDRLLIEKGTIPARHLYTIRKGELVLENVKGKVIPAATELIKIRGKNNSWMCFFFNPKEKACAIYRKRPIECRILKCWDTREIENAYSLNRLCRRDLLSGMEGLWEVIEDHAVRCAYEKISSLAKALDRDDSDEALKELMDIIKYDFHLREVFSEKGAVEKEMMDFLLGRPLLDTIKGYGPGVSLKISSHFGS
jgi:Fe-S-cluster containining protein